MKGKGEEEMLRRRQNGKLRRILLRGTQEGEGNGELFKGDMILKGNEMLLRRRQELEWE
jgi:hypothetical protein